MRRESLNQKLALLAAGIAEKNGAAVDVASMRKFETPSYDGDVESTEAEAAKHYACIRRAWVEFLGETPGAGEDRVDPPPAAS